MVHDHDVREPNDALEVPAFTVALSVYAGVMLVGALVTWQMRGAPHVGPDTEWTFVLATGIALLWAGGLALVVGLRVRRSRYAYHATAAACIVAMVHVPLGTALFLYWLLKVRKVERE